MSKIIVNSGIVFITLLALGSLPGCFGLQRAVGCSNPGIFGCKDKELEVPEITQVPDGDSGYLKGHEHPWSRQLDDCMAVGETRTECIANLPPDILEEFEAWEAERATRRREIQQRSGRASFGVESVQSNTRD